MSHDSKDDSPRVLVLAKRFPPRAGGVAQYSYQVASAYARRGIPVTAITQAESEPGLSVDAEQARLRVLNIGPGSQPAAFAKFVLAVARMRRKENYSLVHATTWKMGIVARIAAASLPLVVTVHGREVLNVPAVARGIVRRVLGDARLMFTVSRATMEITRPILKGAAPKGDWLVRYNGLTSPEDAAMVPPRPADRSSITILSLCRLVPRKNVAGALRAVASVQAGSPIPIRVLIAGTGPERAALEELATQLGISSIVSFLGFVPDESVPRLYADADIFLHLHSHVGEGNDFEGFGITIADAMSFGCAVIVGSAGGPAELVADGENGRVVDGLDHDQCVAALRDLIQDSTLRSALGAEAQRSALTRFSWDAHIEPAVALLRGVGD